MVEKIHALKAYEKVQMVKLNPGKVCVNYAVDQVTGEHFLVLMCGTAPIAAILREPNDLAPDFEYSDDLKYAFDAASKVDIRTSPKDFDRVIPEVAEALDDALAARNR